MDDLLAPATKLEPDAIATFRATGGKVVGYACVATPREILDAAGVLPYRIRALGHPDRDLGDAAMSRFNCSFCRACLQLALEGSFDFFDGIIETNGCDHLRGMFENWQARRPRSFFHYLRVPHLLSVEARDAFALELTRLRTALEAHLGVEILDSALEGAIERQNRIRGKLHQLFALRQARPPALTGAEALQLMLLESAVPPSEFEERLDRALDRCRERKLPDPRTRLLLAGSATDEVSLLQEIESGGALLVADLLCFSFRAFWNLSSFAGDPLRALADGYLEHLLCPRMFEDYPRRLSSLLALVEQAQAEGVILTHNKFCDLHGVDNARLRLDLERRGVPVLVLEKEYGAGGDHGRVRTRVQAFLERIGR